MSTLGYLNDSEFEDLRNVFYSQAYETVENLQDLLLELEAARDDGTALKAIKRHVHTLKGDSNSIGLTSVGTLCHSIEDILALFNDDSVDFKYECMDLLLSSVDLIGRLLSESETGAALTETSGLMEKIEALLRKENGRRGENHPSSSTSEDEQSSSEGGCKEHKTSSASGLTEYQELQIQEALKEGSQVYELEILFHPMCADRGSGAFMAIQKLNSIGRVIRSLPDVEDTAIEEANRMTVLLCTRLGLEAMKTEAFIAGITAEIHVDNWNREASGEGEASAHLALRCDSQEDKIRGSGGPSVNARSEILRIEASRVDAIMELAGELIIGRSMIEQVAKDLEDMAPKEDIVGRLLAANSHMERTVTDLQKGIMKMRMVPINHVFRKFPKVVRDLCAARGKVARLEIHGKETELDKGIVDALGEPLSHIFRNLIDHGIEEPDYRKSIGKLEEGIITLGAYHEAGQIVIEASDDGRGIDIDGLKNKAVEKGLLTEDEGKKLPDDDAVNLIFLSGLTTSTTVSETSGRGVGMDAVKSAVDAMKGSIEVNSTPGQGTMFRLRLPLTLAVIEAFLFEVGSQLYAIPVSAVTDVTRIMIDDLVTVEGRDTLLLRDRIISVIRLQELFNVDGEYGKKKFILILGVGSKKIGVLVDRIKGQQELVIKAVDDCHMMSKLVTGASILGNGRVILILDALAILRKTVDGEKKRKVTA